MTQRNLFSAGYRLASYGDWIGQAYSFDRLMRGDLPPPSDCWERGHQAAVIARFCGVSLYPMGEQ